MAVRRILLVEDETDIAELVVLHLQDLCDEIVVARDGHEGMRLATSSDWSLIILDLRLPGPDGLTICRAIRRERVYQPILMLTSKSTELDRVLGLETGADDYVTKPSACWSLRHACEQSYGVSRTSPSERRLTERRATASPPALSISILPGEK